MNFKERANEVVENVYGWHMKNDTLTNQIAAELAKAHELGRSELNAHDKSRAKVLLELSEAKVRIEELETALLQIATIHTSNERMRDNYPEDTEWARSAMETAECGRVASTALAKRGKGE